MTLPLLIDAHQDLAWNIATFGRNYSLPAQETRRREPGSLAVQENGDTLLGYDDYLRGNVALVFSTLFVSPARRKLGDWETQCYRDFNEAHALYRSQIDAYRRLVDAHPDCFSIIETSSQLKTHLDLWRSRSDGQLLPVGLFILMEGAEGVRDPGELAEWWELGARLIGPAWAGTRFCGGTREPGPLTKDGYALLEGMSDLGFGLDLSHMDRQAALQSLDSYEGLIVATHANALARIPGSDSNRHLSDEVIDGLVARNGVIGVVPYNRFLQHGWKPTDPRLPLSLVVDQLDYICQRAGDALHVGIGSDFDGGFGVQQVPQEVDTIADLQKLGDLLAQRGYTPADIANILGGNWLRCVEKILEKA